MIVEPHCSGHRMQYVRWVAQEALSRGHDVTLVTLDYCLSHPLYLAMQDECEGQVKVALLSPEAHLHSEKWLEERGTTSLIKRELGYYRLFAKYFRELSRGDRPDLVFVPCLDYCAYAVGLLGSPFGEVSWGGIVLRPSFHFAHVEVEGPEPRLHFFKTRLFFGLLADKSLKRLLTIDETLGRYIDQNKPDLSGKLQYVPDPVRLDGVYSRTQARQKLEISDDAVVLLVYGALSFRKGIDALLNAAQQPDFPDEVEIVLAGGQDEETKRLLASPQVDSLRKTGRIRELDGFLNDDEEYLVFRAADMVWLGYRGHYTMSGVLVQAGMMELPVIACDTGLIGWLTREHRLGFPVVVDDVRSVVAAIKSLARDRDLAEELGGNGRKNSANHSVSAFAQKICDELHFVGSDV